MPSAPRLVLNIGADIGIDVVVGLVGVAEFEGGVEGRALFGATVSQHLTDTHQFAVALPEVFEAEGMSRDRDRVIVVNTLANRP